MKLIALILASLVVLATSGRVTVKHPPSEPPSADCSTIIYDMVDCISYLSDGSQDKKPSSSCCAGLESVVSADPDCLCVAIKSSSDMGIELNLTRAAALPKDCDVSAPPFSHCELPTPPSAAPGKAPSHSPKEAPSESPDTPPSGPATDAPDNKEADAPAPASGVSRSVPAIAAVVISLVLLIFDVGFSIVG